MPAQPFGATHRTKTVSCETSVPEVARYSPAPMSAVLRAARKTETLFTGNTEISRCPADR